MLSTLFALLADPTRFQIVEYLRHGELTVTELVERLRIQQSGVSRHLGILKNAGVVRVRAAGQQRIYSLCEAPFDEIAAWLHTYRAVWEARLDRFQAELDRRGNAVADRQD